ncbi:glutamine synthetase family protein [Streptomyces sp. HU2014]|uniref:glutamine synthetase family protein n=1 Tax=Streptomyces sp. HU2014 TaxID=2939414 RepID=UPI00200DA676|nr:glutamine synthetase family protein [Streptomyces sp. HU2014]UQI45593.1 glutamine synthetase family protein [Streptomyces sp. HU2014]
MPAISHPGSPAPAGVLTPERLAGMIASGDVETVLLALPDLQGRLKGKLHDAHHYLRQVADHGAEACAYVLATDVDMRPVPGYALTSWDDGYGDLRLVPDPGTARLLPWLPRTALVLADAHRMTGIPVEVSPRQVLRRRLDELAALGLSARAGLEAEFFLYRTPVPGDGTGHGLVPVCAHNLDYALDHPPELIRYLHTLAGRLREAGLPVEAVKTEGAPGQVEVTFPYGDPLAACDGHLVLKHAARALADGAGLAATFMAAPATGLASGLHLHLSLWDEARPVLVDDEGGLSRTGEQAVAGLLAALPHLAPLYAPTVNSYRRFKPGSFAPTHFTWGRDNRTCAVRVTGHGRGLHLEIRLPGADANPYLALAAALAAALHGIRGSLTPPAALTGNAYRAGADAAAVPAGLHEALLAFDDPLADEALTSEVARHYRHTARTELDAYRYEVTDAERRRGFTRA